MRRLCYGVTLPAQDFCKKRWWTHYSWASFRSGEPGRYDFGSAEAAYRWIADLPWLAKHVAVNHDPLPRVERFWRNEPN